MDFSDDEFCGQELPMNHIEVRSGARRVRFTPSPPPAAHMADQDVHAMVTLALGAAADARVHQFWEDVAPPLAVRHICGHCGWVAVARSDAQHHARRHTVGLVRELA